MVKPEQYKVFHVDWANRKLSHVELIEYESVPASPQYTLFHNLFTQNDTIVISFSTSHPAVKLPDHAKNTPYTKLRWGSKYLYPDFGYDTGGVYGTLSIKGVSWYVFVPWAAVVEIVGETTGTLETWTNK